MVKRDEKQLGFEEKYLKKMEKWSEAYKIRTDFVSKFKLKPEKTKGYFTLVGDTSATKTEGEQTNSDGTVVTGDTSGLPTAADYKGPANATAGNPWSPGKPYRSNMKGVIEATDKWNAQLVQWGKEFNINPIFMKMVMALESGGDANLRERGGNGVGLFQITPPNIDTPCDPSRLTDPKYNADIFCKVIHNEKVAQAKAKGSPLTVYEIAWRYNGKSAKGKPYADTVKELIEGVGRSANESIFFTAPDTKTPDNASMENIGGGPPKKSSISLRTMALTETPSITKEEIQKRAEAYHTYNSRTKPMYQVQRGKITPYRFIPPTLSRDGYAILRKNEAVEWNWQGWAPLPDKDFVHLGNPHENFYSPEAREMFSRILMKLGWNRIEVIQGFIPVNKQAPNSMHVAGLAMDIRVNNIMEALFVADTAWECGLRAIAIGGDRLDMDNPGFVHIDCGPAGRWQYGYHDEYNGPGTFAIRW